MASGAKIRVLIVDDVAETRENVRKLLQFEADVEVVGAARSGKEGIQLAQELDPDVILMDINMPDIDGITATETIRQKNPFSQVVILSVQNDQNYMRRAMLAGARDFLSKPPTGDDLISAIRRAAEMSRNERAKSIPPRGVPVPAGTMAAVPGFIPYSQGKIITVYSPKGGTGCTTLAVNLALALSNEDTRVILVDANLQFGDVAVFLNEQGKNTILELAPRITELDPQTIEEIMIKHQPSGVHLLAAPQRPELAEKISADQFSKVLEQLKALYGYLVVDTSPILTDVTLAALDASDIIVLVTTQDIPAIKNARLFLDLMHTMGVPKERIVLAINKYDRQISITPQRIAENFKQEVGAVIPTDERFVLPSVNKGIPFILGNKTHPVSRGIFSLAEAVRARLTALEAEEMDNRR